MRIKLLLVLFTALLLSTVSRSQGTQAEFGKNRVQYHNDFEEWSQYESDNFFVYWYGASRNVGQTVVQFAEYDFAEIQSLLEHRVNEKIQIIVYADLTDFKQSNIGTEEAFTSTAGQTKIVGTTIFVYYDGNHSHLREQIREGIASVYLNTMLFGGNFQEIVQNAVMLNLPAWFKDGLVAYAGEAWSTEQDNALRDALLNPKYRNFNRFSSQNPRLAGHALWYYIAENFGRATVSNLLYLTRINRSVESGFLYVLGTSYESIIRDWENYFRQRYEAELKGRQQPAGAQVSIRNRRKLPVTEVKMSPDGTKLVYALNQLGRFRVFLYDLNKNAGKVIFRQGQKNALQATDYSYPLLAWNPNNSQIAIIFERRDNAKFFTYDLVTRKLEDGLLAEQYQRVYSMSFMDPFTLVFSAVVSSQADIFLYSPRTRQSQRITNDFYDDLDVMAVNVRNRKGILFSSNRPDTLLQASIRRDTLLPLPTLDLFYYDLNGGIPELVRVTRTPLADERQPVAVDTTFFAYLTDRSGIHNREMAYLEDFVHHLEQHIFLKDGSEIVLHADSTLESLDSTMIDSIQLRPVIRQRAITHSVSNYDRNILLQSSAPIMGKKAELVPRFGKNILYVGSLGPESSQHPRNTFFQEVRRRFNPEAPDSLHREEAPQMAHPPAAVPDLQPQLPESKPDTVEAVVEAYLFQTEFGVPKQKVRFAEPEPVKPEAPAEDTVALKISKLPAFDLGLGKYASKPVHRINPTRITPYRLQFRTDFVTTQMDNTLLFEGLDNLAADPQSNFSPPPPGILMKANVKDLFEDYELEGGIRIPTTFNGAEYFFIYNNKKKRLDQRFALYMKNQRFNEGGFASVPRRREANILLGQYGLRYPLDLFTSIRATTTIRRDRVMQLATDRNTFNTPNNQQQRIGLRLEYVFDNTIETGLNLRNGTRYRIFGEVMKKFSLGDKDKLDFQFNDGYLGVLGLDFRHYQPVLKHTVLAARLAGMTSFGTEKMLYFLGGVDNWLFPEQNNTISAPPGNYAFQTLAANLRGFPINIRNGNSYLLLNTELRAPIFRYLFPRSNSPLLRNFQAIGFFDIGTAWAGSDPYREDNPLNTSVFTEGAPGREFIFVTINYFRDPVVAGYGVGARMLLFGYFIRADYGWGIETRNIQKPRLHISLGMDF